MDFDQSDLIVTLLLVVLAVSVLIAISVIAKTFANEAKEKKAKAARLAEEERIIARESHPLIKPQVQAWSTPEAKAKKHATPAHKDDVNNDANLVAAAEVYLTYELKEHAIISLEKHLLKHPTDKEALALLKKAEASD